MKKYFFLFLAGLCIPVTIAQKSFKKEMLQEVTRVQQVDTAYLKLLNDNPTIRNNYWLNEELVDMVTAYEVDSILTLKTQRHRVGPVGWFIRMAGYCWKSINMKRVKIVGTVKGGVGSPGKDHFTEYDVNWNLVPHFRQYQDLLQQAYTFQIKQNRFLRKKKRDGPPFVYKRDDNSGHYRFHCELTPGRPYRTELNEKFYPCVPEEEENEGDEERLREHYNFGEADPTIGVYGPMVADCNHSCHPEIHPYEWIWWMELNPMNDGLPTKRWVVGFFREMSDRFRGWTKKPRVGEISIPFIFRADEPVSTIYIEHLVFGKHRPDGLQKLGDIPPAATFMDFSEMEVTLNGLSKKIRITTNHPLKEKGIKLWLKDMKTDGTWVTGMISFGCSIEDVHTFRVSFSEK